MRISRPARARVAISGLALGLGSLVLQGGCDSGQVDISKPAYTSSEEAARQKTEINNAMKGGAYGKAGKAAANQQINTPK
jgi:hypothetical protein